MLLNMTENQSNTSLAPSNHSITPESVFDSSKLTLAPSSRLKHPIVAVEVLHGVHGHVHEVVVHGAAADDALEEVLGGGLVEVVVGIAVVEARDLVGIAVVAA